jgi:hypothetical protein
MRSSATGLIGEPAHGHIRHLGWHSHMLTTSGQGAAVRLFSRSTTSLLAFTGQITGQNVYCGGTCTETNLARDQRSELCTADNTLSGNSGFWS